MDEDFDKEYYEALKNFLPIPTDSSLYDLGCDLNRDFGCDLNRDLGSGHYLNHYQESPADDIPVVSDGDFCLTPESYPLDPENAAIESADDFIEQPINTAQTVDDYPKNNANLGELTSLPSTSESVDNEQINKIIAQIVEKFFKDDNCDDNYNKDYSIEIENNFFSCEIELESSSIDDNEEMIATISTAISTARKRGRPKKEDKRTDEQKTKERKIKNGVSAVKYRKTQKLEDQENLKLKACLMEKNECLKRTVLELEIQIKELKSKIPANWSIPSTYSTRCSSSSDGDGCDATAAAVAEHNYSKKL